MVDQYGETGGAQKCLLDLLAGWRGSDPVIVAAPAAGPLAESVRRIGFDTHAIPSGPYTEGRKSAADWLRFPLDVRRQREILRAIVREREIDLVYVNGPRVLAGAALAARGLCPLVFHMHNRLHRRSELAVARWALAQGSSVVAACCRHVAQSLPELDAVVIPNGVPDAGHRRHRAPAGTWQIGMVGRISPDKGHLLLLEAVRQLTAQGHRISLTIAGSSLYSPAAYAAQVREQAAGLPVRFTGWIDGVGDMLGGFDLLAVPSTAEPGLPRVVLEAFSAGLPVVALPTGGIPEAIRDGATGFLANAVTAEALAAKLRDAIATPPEVLSNVARTARSEWDYKWNVDRWRRDVMALMETTAERRNPTRERFASSATPSGERRTRSA
jgi:glycosyltransferase involved in cell wall biosynthesis